ncbi:hypothetical protein [Anaerospora hongkongensis]|uniref:hypothetical protein n=1 Tax=Anaerospora hongkongensis TaxID=244830 RepID=UPI0028A0AD9F|nr:hypothetical protein [Anaerospora hongkongensis]
MRFEVFANINNTYTLKDHLFLRSATYLDYNQAQQLADELNQQHREEIAALERQFL